jgi:hypothetical protein
MGRVLALVVGLLLGGAAFACQCSFVPLGTKEAQAATNVFVFRLMDARVVPGVKDAPNTSVVGTIKVVAHIRGRTRAQQIRYSTFYCCGSRLEIGKYYIAFLSSDAPKFDANASNVLPLWQDFGRREADNLEAVLRGKKQLEDVFPYGLDEIHQVRPPPPPCSAQAKKPR